MHLQRLKDLRVESGKTQQQIADVLSCRKETYLRYENCTAKIPVRLLIILADYYETSMDYILGITDAKKPHPRKKIRQSDRSIPG